MSVSVPIPTSERPTGGDEDPGEHHAADAVRSARREIPDSGAQTVAPRAIGSVTTPAAAGDMPRVVCLQIEVLRSRSR